MTDLFKHRLQRKSKLSRKQAYNLVMTMAMYSDYDANVSRGIPFSTEDEVREYFKAGGYDFDKVVEECRNPQISIPLVENLVGSTWLMIGDDKTETIVTSNYEGAYETAEDHLERAIKATSFSELESAIVRGIASIEAFINYRAGVWNERNPENQLVDSKQNKVSFDDKIDKWIPIMSGGGKLHKGDDHWRSFKRLLGIRDNLTIHSKSTSHTVTHSELADLINAFRSGIAGILIDLHVLCRTWVPASMIRGYYAPEVQVVKND